MSNSWNFYIEVRDGPNWITPNDLLPPDPWSSPKSFSWLLHYRYDFLFENDRALLPFHLGYPSDIGAVWRESTRSWLLGFDAKWIGYPQLMVDFWRDKGTLLVGNSVSVHFASLFADGNGEFPAEALKAAGCFDVDLLPHRSSAENPIDRQSGYALAKLIEKTPEAQIPVTWRTSIVELLGDETCNDFINLRQYGRDEDIRVIAFYS